MVRRRKFSDAASGHPGPQAGQAADQHATHRHPLSPGHQQVAGLMHGDPAQASLATRQGFSQQVTTTAGEGCGIQAERAQEQAHPHGDPPG